MSREAPQGERIKLPGHRCPYCHDEVERAASDKLACNECMAWHHSSCWREHGSCAACGAVQTGLEANPDVAPLSAYREDQAEVSPFMVRTFVTLLGVPTLLICIAALAGDMAEAGMSTPLSFGGVLSLVGIATCFAALYWAWLRDPNRTPESKLGQSSSDKGLN